MAVTVVSSPPVSPSVLSASYPAIIELSSSVWGGSGITQFRYVAEVTALVSLGIKYTVPSVAYSSTGYFDVKDLFKLMLDVEPYEWNGGAPGTDPLPQITAPIQQSNYVQWSFQVVIKEQYYNSGVFTTNTGSTLTFLAGRGWTDKTDSEWFYCNYAQLAGNFTDGNWLPFSGKAFQLIAMKVKDTSWTDSTTKPYFGIQVYSDPGNNLVGEWWFLRDTSGYQGSVYIPLKYAGYTDQEDFEKLTIYGFISPTAAIEVSTEEVEEIILNKTIDSCEDEHVIMFLDRFFQWSFISFSKHRKDTTNTIPQSAEALNGRFRYNVKSSDTLTLNTDWVPDETNELMRDLVATEKCYLVDPDDGSIEQVTVVQNSLRIQTSLSDGLHQYQMQFRKSLDNFRP